MKIIVLAAIRRSLVFTAVTALSVAYPALVRATTYDYTGNPFTVVSGVYTTSDFVSGMVTLADPLAPNMPLTIVRPTAFTFSDGVQTFTNRTPSIQFLFRFATGPTGSITSWDAILASGLRIILTSTVRGGSLIDQGDIPGAGGGTGMITLNPGSWGLGTSVPDTGSTLSLMTLTLMALGVAARRPASRFEKRSQFFSRAVSAPAITRPNSR